MHALERPGARVTVVIPTRNRANYLEHALVSLTRQSLDPEAYEIVVVDDRSTDATPATVRRVAGTTEVPVRLIENPRSGLNAARNAATAAARAPLIAFVDDDVEAPHGWIEALLDGADRHPRHDAFAGPIRARLEGRRWRSCSPREAPVTTLDLGPADADADRAWGANMAVRRSTVERIGPFDETIHGGGDEEEWEDRLLAGGGRIAYVAAAGIVHRRSRDDASLASLSRAAYSRGRNLRAYDARRGAAPPLATEVRNLAGCIYHAARRRCHYGIVMAAHSAGRIAGAIGRNGRRHAAATGEP